MRVLGIDPGTTNLGWAVLDDSQTLVAAGTTHVSTDLSQLAVDVSRFLSELISHYRPDFVIVEKQMRDVMIAVAQSAITAALCRGVPARLLHPATAFSHLNLERLGHSQNKIRNLRFIRDSLHYPVASHHEADAVLLALAYLVSQKCCERPE